MIKTYSEFRLEKLHGYPNWYNFSTDGVMKLIYHEYVLNWVFGPIGDLICKLMNWKEE